MFSKSTQAARNTSVVQLQMHALQQEVARASSIVSQHVTACSEIAQECENIVHQSNQKRANRQESLTMITQEASVQGQGHVQEEESQESEIDVETTETEVRPRVDSQICQHTLALAVTREISSICVLLYNLIQEQEQEGLAMKHEYEIHITGAAKQRQGQEAIIDAAAASERDIQSKLNNALVADLQRAEDKEMEWKIKLQECSEQLEVYQVKLLALKEEVVQKDRAIEKEQALERVRSEIDKEEIRQESARTRERDERVRALEAVARQEREHERQTDAAARRKRENEREREREAAANRARRALEVKSDVGRGGEQAALYADNISIYIEQLEGLLRVADNENREGFLREHVLMQTLQEYR